MPAWAPDGRLVRIADEGGARVLVVGDRPLTGPQLHLRAVLDVGERRHPGLRVGGRGGRAIPRPARCMSTGSNELGRRARLGRRRGALGGPRRAVTAASRSARPGPDAARPSRVLRRRQAARRHRLVRREPVADRRASRLTEGGARRIPCAVLLPTGYQEADGPLPVLLDPYGGPHGQRVVAAHNAAPDLAVVRRPGLRGDRRRRPGHPGPLPRLGEGDQGRPRGGHPGRPDRRAAGARRSASRWTWAGWRSAAGPAAATSPALAVLRRPDVFHAADRRRARHRPAAVRHALHGALPRRTRRASPRCTRRNSLVTDDGLSRRGGDRPGR